ncbi:hypothetical protein B9Z19DRAFT_760792 [Tuber borchii]|uniref:Uncharacterized protein n=1 Tax=Tuber borchii TaxID=42251 RepID=A0A2T6ZXB6_TUBBO|nr:hypothetical protein B9Z19DRAFT_760792 [Tuber borchii]
MCPPTYHQQSIIQLVVKTVLLKKKLLVESCIILLRLVLLTIISCRRIIHGWSSGLTVNTVMTELVCQKGRVKKCKFFFLLLLFFFICSSPFVSLYFCFVSFGFMLPFCAFDIMLVFNVLHRLVLLRLFRRSFVRFIVRFIVHRSAVCHAGGYYISRTLQRFQRWEGGESGWEEVGPIEFRPCTMRGRYLIYFTIL